VGIRSCVLSSGRGTPCRAVLSAASLHPQVHMHFNLRILASKISTNTTCGYYGSAESQREDLRCSCLAAATPSCTLMHE